ncbi:MAG: GspE/PulE family protein [Patescibacteria group bacterium]
MEKLLGSVQIPEIIADDVKKSVKSIMGFGEKIKEYISQNTTNLLDVVLCGAVIIGSSDIHIEPEKEKVKLRTRIDGVLQDVALLEHDIYHNLLSRIKLLSKIKLNITDKPQDGRFTISIKNLLVEIRTSSLPAEFGESIVMRVLNPENFLALETLGLRKDLYKILEKEIKRPNGMVIITGPTGAGKTTTLYAFLTKIKSPGIKIITIEDPIEYHISGISQTQAAPEKGYSFSEGLKSIVRQDPDVILVGEIRDLETAKIALQASLTGHLVLTTLHTNDAAGTIPRLVDLGASPKSIAPAIKIVIAQRLVRRVCKKCSFLIKPSKQELVEIKKGLKGVPKEIIGIKDFSRIKIAKANERGCSICNHTGYFGRKGLFEVFLTDAEVEKFILTDPPTSSIKEKAIKKGMVTIYQSGLIEVVLGQTTLQEVKKVVGEEAR